MMKSYTVYYLTDGTDIKAGPFSTVDAAVEGKKKFHVLYRPLLEVVKGTIKAESV